MISSFSILFYNGQRLCCLIITRISDKLRDAHLLGDVIISHHLQAIIAVLSPDFCLHDIIQHVGEIGFLAVAFVAE